MIKLPEELAYKDFKKLDIRVGTVESCEKVEGSDKLFKLMVDCGEDEHRQILSSLVDWYTEEELVGKVTYCAPQIMGRRGQTWVSLRLILIQ